MFYMSEPKTDWFKGCHWNLRHKKGLIHPLKAHSSISSLPKVRVLSVEKRRPKPSFQYARRAAGRPSLYMSEMVVSQQAERSTRPSKINLAHTRTVHSRASQFRKEGGKTGVSRGHWRLRAKICNISPHQARFSIGIPDQPGEASLWSSSSLEYSHLTTAITAVTVCPS